MKDYLQPAATFALALAIASVPFTLPMGAKAISEYIKVTQYGAAWDVRITEGCN